MMIRDKNSHPQFLRIRNLVDGSNSVIAGNDCIHLRIRGLGDQVAIQSVSILDPIGDGHGNLRSAAREPTVQNVGRHHTVNVIVTDYSDMFPLPKLLHQYLCQKRSVLQQMRVRKLRKTSGQKAPD